MGFGGGDAIYGIVLVIRDHYTLILLMKTGWYQLHHRPSMVALSNEVYCYRTLIFPLLDLHGIDAHGHCMPWLGLCDVFFRGAAIN